MFYTKHIQVVKIQRFISLLSYDKWLKRAIYKLVLL